MWVKQYIGLPCGDLSSQDGSCSLFGGVMGSVQGVDVSLSGLTAKQSKQYTTQVDFLKESLNNIFKTTMQEAFSNVVVTQRSGLILWEVKSNVRDLIPALDIKLISLQNVKRIGLKEGDVVLVIREMKNG